ncbi:BgTH12-04921 [Blumeria graminis f. sp. triticale]|uniref:BgTH12-04921 n=1 Tax=Blumeria graminis f. sp. triticale TaxID=1689686 RepID=A0A9W4GF24_BLUGR|nr:BgTH12-04921 [Blumeria graminis f. sp. triticale]
MQVPVLSFCYCVIPLYLFSFAYSAPPLFRAPANPNSIVNGLGLPISNMDAPAEDVIANRYIVVYSKDATDDAVESHQTTIKTALKKRSLNATSIDGRQLSPMMHTFKMGGWRGMCLDAEDAMIIDIESAAEVSYVEADTQVGFLELTEQIEAPIGLVRLSHALKSEGKEYVFDNASDGAGVVGFVIDTGIRASHVEFGGRATLKANFIDDINEDLNGHGSHVAATIGGASFGVAKNIELVGIKVLDAKGKGSNANVLRGVNFVAAEVAERGLAGKAVVNISIGGSKSKALNTAIEALTKAGVTVVVAAGNSNKDATNFSPASAPSAITVGAIDPTTDKRASFSNFGAFVDIFAPGVKILSAGIADDNAVATLSGTSMASPHIAGLAAYLISTESLTTPEAVLARMLELARSTNVKVDGQLTSTIDLIAYNGSGL